MVALALMAVEVFNYQAPPAWVFLQALHFQMPTTSLLTQFFPQNGQSYLDFYWVTNFFTIFLNEAPYLVPYLPTIPTFLVLLVIANLS
jgi:hypothetical protein